MWRCLSSRWGRPLTKLSIKPRYFCSGKLVDLHELDPRTFLIVEAKRDRPGVLGEILELFTRSAINMTHIESRFKSFARDGPSFHIDFQGSLKEMEVQELMKAIKSLPGVYDVSAQEPREVPWFPMNIRELDLTVDTLDGGTELINQDHPGFHDPVYRERRTEIVSMAKSYKHGEKLPRVKYTEQETATWQAVYERLHALHEKWACREYREMLPQMEKYCGYAVNNIPQCNETLDQISGACEIYRNCCATAKCSKKTWFRPKTGLYARYEKCKVIPGPWRKGDDTLVNPVELSFGEPQLAAKLMVGDYVCREECDIWMEDDSGYRPSSEPENHTVYRTGGIADTDELSCFYDVAVGGPA
eukprot:symbB.v1.2.028016.t1/scaffold2923.1/size67120/2